MVHSSHLKPSGSLQLRMVLSMSLVHPSTNGQAERLVQSFKKGVKADKSSRTLQHKLDRFLLAYQSAPRAITEPSSAQLLLG